MDPFWHLKNSQTNRPFPPDLLCKCICALRSCPEYRRELFLDLTTKMSPFITQCMAKFLSQTTRIRRVFLSPCIRLITGVGMQAALLAAVPSSLVHDFSHENCAHGCLSNSQLKIGCASSCSEISRARLVSHGTRHRGLLG